MDRLKVRFLAHNLINLSYLIGTLDEKLKNNTSKEQILIDLDISKIFITELYNDEFISEEFEENFLKLIEDLKEEVKNNNISEKNLEKIHNFCGDLEKETTNNIIYIP